MSAKRRQLVILVSAWDDNDTVRGRIRHDARGAPQYVTFGSLEQMISTFNTVVQTWHEFPSRDGN